MELVRYPRAGTRSLASQTETHAMQVHTASRASLRHNRALRDVSMYLRRQ